MANPRNDLTKIRFCHSLINSIFFGLGSPLPKITHVLKSSFPNLQTHFLPNWHIACSLWVFATQIFNVSHVLPQTWNTPRCHLCRWPWIHLTSCGKSSSSKSWKWTRCYTTQMARPRTRMNRICPHGCLFHICIFNANIIIHDFKSMQLK